MLKQDCAMKPFKNVVFSDEDFEKMIKHLEFMEDYMLKLNKGQETPDNGTKKIFHEHFDEVRRLTPPALPMTDSIKMAMAKIYQTHPAFAHARASLPKVAPVVVPARVSLPIAPVKTSTDLEALLPNFKTREELFEFVATLGNLALNAVNQKIDFSEEDKKEILQIIEILENQPKRLLPGSDIIEIKTYYDTMFKRFIANEYIKRITAQMVFSNQDKGKKKKLN